MNYVEVVSLCEKRSTARKYTGLVLGLVRAVKPLSKIHRTKLIYSHNRPLYADIQKYMSDTNTNLSNLQPLQSMLRPWAILLLMMFTHKSSIIRSTFAVPTVR